ncbi:MAG: hypothetical protein EOP56_12240 [Sphingobacteriales bacterium]|nr:MAG: hypothetical protein EOP56_12240 [Sphingobacteriales bacterium]
MTLQHLQTKLSFVIKAIYTPSFSSLAPASQQPCSCVTPAQRLRESSLAAAQQQHNSSITAALQHRRPLPYAHHTISIHTL